MFSHAETFFKKRHTTSLFYLDYFERKKNKFTVLVKDIRADYLPYSLHNFK